VGKASRGDNPVVDDRQRRAVEVLGGETSLPGLLHAATREFVDVVGGDACAISRVVGQVLIQVAEHALDGRTLVLGHGYLISDFPLTEKALEKDEPHCVSVHDPDPDPREAALLTELGFESLLMLPLLAADTPWGLAEIYVNGRQFGQDDVAAAQPLAQAFGERLTVLPAAASTR
jgi:transcriptional regulator with GAF, ATPase, and Fis domain